MQSPVGLGQPTGVLSSVSMDDDITFLNQCKVGTLQATVWETFEYDVYSEPARQDYLVQLTNDSGSIQFNVLDVGDLISVLKPTLQCVKEHSEEEISKGISKMLAAFRDAGRSRTNPSL